MTSGNAKDFWQASKFLDIQSQGNSQHELLTMLAIPLKKETGLDLKDCGSGQTARYIYLDDGLFTGLTILNSLKSWLKDAPQKAHVHVVVIALHRLGQYYARTNLEKAAKESGKDITFSWWRLIELEDRRTYINDSDVLRPTVIPDDERVRAYIAKLKFPPTLRTAGKLGGLKVFSSEDGRSLVEQQFLIKGAYIREIAPKLPEYARPLGNMVLQTLGFGSTIVTYRNCPNNAPLAFWAGDPWYPLFPRKTN